MNLSTIIKVAWLCSLSSCAVSPHVENPEASSAAKAAVEHVQLKDYRHQRKVVLNVPFDIAVSRLDRQLGRCMGYRYDQIRRQDVTHSSVKPVNQLVHLNVVARNHAEFSFQPFQSSAFMQGVGGEYLIEADLTGQGQYHVEVDLQTNVRLTRFSDTMIAWMNGHDDCLGE